MKKNRKYGLIGKNIDYSFSKKFFSEKFEKENLNCIYSNFDIENISHVKSILQDDTINGFNVTIPYKEEILKYSVACGSYYANGNKLSSKRDLLKIKNISRSVKLKQNG